MAQGATTAAPANVVVPGGPPKFIKPKAEVVPRTFPEFDAAFPDEEVSFDAEAHTYQATDGTKLPSVTSKLHDGDETEAIIERMTSGIADTKTREREARRLRAEFDEKREGGTLAHAELQQIIEGDREGKDPVKIAIVDEITENGRLDAIAEQKIYSKDLGLAGTADVVVKHADGSFGIYDKKTIDELPVDGSEEYGDGYYMEYDGPEGKRSKHQTHSLQLMAYKKILESKGFRVSKMGIVLTARDGSGYKIVDAAVDDKTAAMFKGRFGHEYVLGKDTSKTSLSDEDYVGSAAVDMAMQKTFGHKNRKSREEYAADLANFAKGVSGVEGYADYAGGKKEAAALLEKMRKLDGKQLKDIRKALKEDDLSDEMIAAVFKSNGWSFKIGDKDVKPRTTKAPKKSLAPDQIRKIVDENTNLGPHIIVFSSIEEIEDMDVRMWLAVRGDNVQGFFYGGKIYINATMIESVRELGILLAHEALHAAEQPYLYKLMRKFGVGGAVDEWNRILDRVWNDFKGEISELHKDGYEKIFDIETVEGQRDMAREFLSERGATGPKATWMDRLVAAFRKIVNYFLTKMGKEAKPMSEAEVRVLVSDMGAALREHLAQGKELDQIGGIRPKVKGEGKESKTPAPQIDVVDGRAIVKKKAALGDLPPINTQAGPNPGFERQAPKELRPRDAKRRTEEGEAYREKQEKQSGRVAPVAERASDKKAAEEAAIYERMIAEYGPKLGTQKADEEIKRLHAAEYQEKQDNLAIEEKKDTVRRDAEYARKQERKQKEKADAQLIVDRIVEKRTANFKRSGEGWESRLKAEQDRIRAWIGDLQSRGVKVDENMLDGALFAQAVDKAKTNRKAEEDRAQKQQARDERARRATEAAKGRAVKTVEMIMPDEGIVLDPMLREPGRKVVDGLDLTELRKSIAKHSAMRFEWADYIKDAIKNERYDVLLSGILDAFASASVEAAILSTQIGEKGVVKPDSFAPISRDVIRRAEFNGGADLLSSAIREMQDVEAVLSKLVSKYQKGSHAEQYGDLFEDAVSRFNSALYNLYQMRRGNSQELALGTLFKQIRANISAYQKKLEKNGENYPEGRNVNSIARLKWSNFPSLAEYFDYLLDRFRYDLDNPKDTLRSGLPNDIKDLVAASRTVQALVSFFRNRIKESYESALIEAAELQMVSDVDSIAAGVVSEEEASFIGTAFKTLRRANEKESEISEEDIAGLDLVQRVYDNAGIVRSGIISIGNRGNIYGGDPKGGRVSDEKNIIPFNVEALIGSTYTFIVNGLLGIDLANEKSTKFGIFDYEYGDTNLIKNLEHSVIENTPGDMRRISDMAERLGLPVPSTVVPIIPRIDGKSALDYYMEIANEKQEGDETLAALSDDELMLAILGVGYNDGPWIFDPQYMSDELKEKLVGVGAMGIDTKGNFMPFVAYSQKSSIGKIISAPISSVITLPDNPGMGTFVGHALTPAGSYSPRPQSYETDTELYADRSDDDILLQHRPSDDLDKFGVARSFRPGSILYHQANKAYYVVGPQIKEENGKIKYEIIKISTGVREVKQKDGSSVNEYRLRIAKKESVNSNGAKSIVDDREWLTISQLSMRPVAVVPRVWDILSGHGKMAISKAERKSRNIAGNVEALDNYRVYTTMRMNGAKSMLRDIESRTGLPVSLVSFGHITKDVNGRKVLAVAAPGGQIVFFRVDKTNVANIRTDIQAMNDIVDAIVKRIRDERLHLFRRQPYDQTTHRDVNYMRDLIKECTRIGLDVVGKMVMKDKISHKQGAMAREYIRNVSMIAAVDILTDGEVTMDAMAAAAEQVFSDRVGSYDEEGDSIAFTGQIILEAAKRSQKKGSFYLKDLLGDINSLDTEAGPSSDDLLHMMAQSSDVNEEGDESFKSQAVVKVIGDLPQEFVDSQVQEYISAIIEGYDYDPDFEQSRSLTQMQADLEKVQAQLRDLRYEHLRQQNAYVKAYKEKSALPPGKSPGTLKKMLEKGSKFAKQMAEIINRRLESEKAAHEHRRAEIDAAISNASEIAKTLKAKVDQNPTIFYEINDGEFSPIYAKKHFSERILSYMSMTQKLIMAKFIEAQANGKDLTDDPAAQSMALSYQANMFVSFLLANSRSLANMGFSSPQVRLVLATILRDMPIPQSDGSYRLFKDVSMKQRAAVVEILGRAALLQELFKRQIQLSKLPTDHIFTEFLFESGKMPYQFSTTGEVLETDVPGLVHLLTGLTDQEAIKAHIERSNGNPLGLPTARGFDSAGFALLVANGQFHPLFGYLATGDSLDTAQRSVKESVDALYRVRDKRTNTPSEPVYGEEHVMPDYFAQLLEEEVAERFMSAVEAAEDESSQFFPYKKAVARARENIAAANEKIISELRGAPSRASSMSEKERPVDGHFAQDLGRVQRTANIRGILDAEITKIPGAAQIMHNILLDIPGVDPTATSVEDVDSFVSKDGSKYHKMLYHEMFLEESYLGISELSPSSHDMKIVDVINYIIPGFIKMSGGGISGNPNFRETTRFNGDNIIVVNDATYSPFGYQMMRVLTMILDAIRQTPRAFKPDMRNRAYEVMMANIVNVYGERIGGDVISRVKTALGFGPGNAPALRINHTGKIHALRTNEEEAINSIKEAAEDWLDELDTVKAGGRPNIIVHASGVSAESQLRWMSQEEKDSLSKIYKDFSFALKNAFGFRDKNGDIHIFLDQHIGEDGQVDMTQVMRTVYHEYVAHVGLRRTLGTAYDSTMLMIFDKYCNPGGTKSTLPDNI